MTQQIPHINPHNPVGWFEIYVQDIARARQFYETVFQTTLQLLPSPNSEVELWAFPKTESGLGISGALVKMAGFTPSGNSTIIYFASANCTTEIQRVERAGGSLFKDKFSIGDYGFIALVIDSEGNMIGLHSML